MRPLSLKAFAAAGALVLGSALLAQGAYSPGQRVEVYSSMSGAWEAGTIVRLDGQMGDGRARYMFQADSRNLSTSFWGTTAENIRPEGGAAAAAQQPARAAPTSAPFPQATQPVVAARPPAPPAPGSCGGGGSGSVSFAGSVAAPLGRGLFANGEPMGVPGQSNYKDNRNGQHSIVAVAPPGLAPFVGRYNLMVGGTWSTASIQDLGGGVTRRTLNWNVPARANVLAINADGTWYRKSGSENYHGRWIDLGQNVAQLIGYDDDDWTGSIQQSGGVCRMEMRSPVGQNEWGRPF